MITYALQKAAILEAKKRGAREYDLFGIAPEGDKYHPLSGLSRFKLGFGAKRVNRMGCWDYPLSKAADEFFIEEQTGKPTILNSLWSIARSYKHFFKELSSFIS